MSEIHGGDIYRNQVKLDFSVNINPLGMPKEVEKALVQSVGECTRYPDIHAQKLRAGLAQLLKAEPWQVVFGNGASELFMALIHALRPRKVLLPIPSFYGYEYVAKAAGSEIMYYPLREEESFVLDEKLCGMLSEDMDLLFLANPNNPTGRRIRPEALLTILEECKRRGIYVVLDECFIGFCGEEYSMVERVKEFPRLLIVRAFTKLYAIPGIRLGYLVCGEEEMALQISRQLPEWNLSVPAQRAGEACLGLTDYRKKTLLYIREERCHLLEELKKLGLKVFEGDGDFLLLYSEIPLYERLLEKGILIRNCENFKGLSRGYYRIAVKRREENERLQKAIGECIEQDRICAARRD